jgi:uncharacterized protein
MGTDCRQYFVVEHNGDIYPCDFFVEPQWKLGNIHETEWEELQKSELYKEFGIRKHKWNSNCPGCEYLKFCQGDCPKHRLACGDSPEQLSVLCEGWKSFYPHTLKNFERLAGEVRLERQEHYRKQQQIAAQAAQNRQRTSAGKPGRNDPCPCGSGKKYKKCCGR